MNDRHYLSVLVRDRPGVLQRVSGLFSRRGYNIDSVTVGASELDGHSRLIAAARGSERELGQIASQLRKLIDVVSVSHLSVRPSVVRELMLVRLSVPPASRAAVRAVIETFRCVVVDVGPATMMIQSVGDREKNDALLTLLQDYGILEIARTGETAMTR
ncbi:acetolactate synthase small subunit [Cohnella sp. JJ-181]|uniref:acetolactate synthase small subunit n=1 Tax=Cohnella rhizoplanae TaxID=2974897 RepID=UPI0022FFAAF8|nr:acetolactate synthase small subunit [Cohnella sp. JJ-181]CAI6084519.1 Putative acetolactate synthase small subunit [Cohnella sp. JJ-181]